MADPIPRNSRADETAEYRRAQQERRGNRPLFGEGIGGGLRARIDNAQQVRANPAPNPFARPAQAQPQARPNPIPPPRANPPPAPLRQAEPPGWVAALRRVAENIRQERAPQARRVVRPRSTREMLVGGSIFGVIMVIIGARAMFGAQPPAVPDTAASQSFIAAAPMIPASAPAEICAVQLTDTEIVPDEPMSDGRRVIITRVTVSTRGCAGQMVRVAVWIFQAENQPLLAANADPVYRSPLNQLTVQSLFMAEMAEESAQRSLVLPHVQFPTAVGTPLWLTVGVQAWPEGRPAPAGSMRLQQVLFTRAE